MKTTLKLLGTIVLAVGLAFGTMLVVDDSINHSFNANHPAGSSTINPTVGATTVYLSASQINALMLLALVYGENTAAFYMCANQFTWNTVSFNDCGAMLGSEGAAYSYPIMQFWAHWGVGVLFQWNKPWNEYLGYTAI